MHHSIDLTFTFAGILSLVIFSTSYLLVMGEEFTHLRKSKPVILASGLIWAIIAIAYSGSPHAEVV